MEISEKLLVFENHASKVGKYGHRELSRKVTPTQIFIFYPIAFKFTGYLEHPLVKLLSIFWIFYESPFSIFHRKRSKKRVFCPFLGYYGETWYDENYYDSEYSRYIKYNHFKTQYSIPAQKLREIFKIKNKKMPFFDQKIHFFRSYVHIARVIPAYPIIYGLIFIYWYKINHLRPFRFRRSSSADDLNLSTSSCN